MTFEATPSLIDNATVEPETAWEPPAGVCSTTVPAGRYDPMTCVVTLNCASWRIVRASSIGLPITYGTPTNDALGNSSGGIPFRTCNM